MWIKSFILTRSRFLLVLSQVLVLLISVGYLVYFYQTNILPDKLAQQAFQETQSLLLNKRLTTDPNVDPSYRAEFLISYNVNGVQYNRWVTSNGLDTSYSQNEEEQQALLSRYLVGKQYPCWYDPESPQIAMLIKRHNWVAMIPMIIPTLLGLMAVCYLLKTLFMSKTIPLQPAYRANAQYPESETNETKYSN